MRIARVPDKLQRAGVAARSRHPGNTAIADRWAPARQRTVEPDDASHRRGTLRCVQGTRAKSSARSLLLVIARSPCDEAIQNPAAERFWIASAFAKGFRGQVAALAMTECEATLRSPSNTCHSPRRRGMQYAAASRFNHWRLGVLDRPVKPGDDTECVDADVRIRPRSAFRPSFA